MNLFSILIVDGLNEEPLSLPSTISRNIASFKSFHPDLPHYLYGRQDIRKFIIEKMGTEVLWAFDQLLPYAYKADLARLCLLYELGGIYADLSVCFHGSWNVLPGKISIFRDRAVIAPWIVSNTIIAAPPRFPAVEAAIRMIIANCRARNRGTSPLCPTGPVLLGKAIALHCEPGQVHMGEVTNVAGRDAMESLVFVDANDGRMIGFRSKTTAGLTELGLHAGVNNYNDFYFRGVIYNSDFPVTIPAEYLYKNGHTSCSLNDDTLEYVCENPAHFSNRLLVQGNFLPFCPGSYSVTVDIPAAAVGSVLTLLITQIEDKKELSQASMTIEQDCTATLTAYFELTMSRSDIGIGLVASNSMSISVKQIQICRIEGNPLTFPAQQDSNLNNRYETLLVEAGTAEN